MRRDRLLLSALMVGGGLVHFLAPGAYEPLVPRALGAPRFWVLASGAAEAAAGGLLAPSRTRRLGAYAVAGMLLAVWPGNIQMALDGGYPGADGIAGSAALAWLRVPLQIPLLAWAWSLRKP